MLTSLVGRDDDVASIASVVNAPDERLITLVGPGGIGKTRIALEIALGATTTFTGGIHTALLSQVERADSLLPSVADALGIKASPGDDLLEVLIGATHGAPHLLVLDNLEHVLEAAPSLVPLLLGSPSLTILITSRGPLRLTGERIIEVHPLATPDDRRPSSLDELRDFPAVQLFEQRARAVSPGFELTTRNGPIVARICQQLDGIPLAIELAAAQSAILTPAALLARIEEHLPYPLDGPRDVPTNRRTMRDTIGWSYSLIPAAAQAVFRAAGVFPGSFSAEAIEAVCNAQDDDTPPRSDILTTVAQLHAQSLLAAASSRDTPRFRMLRTIRRFALDQASETGELDALREHHGTFYLDVAERNSRGTISPGAETVLAELEEERPNLLAALDWFESTGQSNQLLRLAVALSGFWIERGHYREGAEWLQRALVAAPDAPVNTRARALVALALLSGFRTDPGAAGQLFDEGMATLVNEGDAETIAIARIWQGGVALRAGNLDAADEAFAKGLEASGSVPPGPAAATLRARVMSNLGIVAHQRGDFDTAAERLHSALATYHQHDDALGMARAHRDLADLLRDRGDFTAAVHNYQQSLSSLGESTDPRVVMDAFHGTALALAAWGQHETAARLLGAAEILADELGPFAVVPTDMAAHRRTLAILWSSLDASTLRHAWDTGRALMVDEAVRMVLSAEAPADDVGPTIDQVRLSAREEEVLRMVAEGLPDREIASRLFLSVRTVEAHVLRIRSRFGVRTRTAAVTAAIALGLLDAPHTPGD